MSDGSVAVDVNVDDSYYYQILSDYVGIPIEGEYQLMQLLSSMADVYKRQILPLLIWRIKILTELLSSI